MHTVVETPAYLRHARDCGLRESEMAAIAEMVAQDPMCGDEIAGTGGCRKIRVARQGKGKVAAIVSSRFLGTVHSGLSDYDLCEEQKG